MIALNTLALGAASLFAVVAADHGHAHPRAHHHDVAERSEHHLQKRFSGTGTYYITGLGACGIYNNPSDKIVALNSAQFGGGYPGPNCFKMITICKGSNCHPAQITDECPTCDYGSLDLSQSLFQQFASTDDGVFPMTWSFNDDAAPEPTTTKQPDPPKTTKKPEPTTTWEPPTTTWEPPTTTSTKKRTSSSSPPPPETTSTPEPTTSTSTSSSTSSTPTTTSTSETPTYAASTSEVSVSAAKTSAAPSASASTGPASGPSSGSESGTSSGSNLADMNQVMLGMGKMAVAANGA